ncbi:MAG: ATP-binding protein [Herpetosiphonaceae bacterium]|nr:ATP-binding protein [Herpetosiphonaceae bacterium]
MIDVTPTPLVPATVCVICRSAGFLRYDVPISDPLFGQIKPCRCKEFERAQRQSALLRQQSGIDRCADKTFENFNPQRDNLSAIHQRCLEYAAAPHNWLLLRGSYGCGKTHLAAAIANTALERGNPVVFATTPDLLDSFRATFDSDSEITYEQHTNLIRTVDLLVLDDLGTENSTPFAKQTLFQIINHRSNFKLPTVITTNLENSDLDPRLSSRFTDITICEELRITAPDFRPLSFEQRRQKYERSAA